MCGQEKNRRVHRLCLLKSMLQDLRKMNMRNLSKSKLIAYRQCPKRLWLEINAPELREDSSATQANFNVGYEVGDVAMALYDSSDDKQVVDIGAYGIDAAFEQTQQFLLSSRPIFEAGFSAAGGLAFADVLLPDGPGAWRMVEVKSSTKVKDYHKEDIAIQSYIAQSAGLNLTRVSLAHIDSSWEYKGDADYKGLLVEEDLTELSNATQAKVKKWIAKAQKISSKKTAPKIATGDHCFDPYDCGFYDYCKSGEPQAEFPVEWLPNRNKLLKETIKTQAIIELDDLNDDDLNEKQRRVKHASLNGTTFFDSVTAMAALEKHEFPIYFIDFETINLAVPIWAGTRPYQQMPFQWSAHKIDKKGQLTHQEFLDVSGSNPSENFAKKLIEACGKSGAIFVYSAPFEKSRIKELAARHPELENALFAIIERVVDLLPLAREVYYHPSQHGSWSIKKVLPAIAPELNYADLEGVQHGGAAMEAFAEAIHPETQAERKEQLRQQLLKYCELDTYAMIKIWQYFYGNTQLKV